MAAREGDRKRKWWQSQQLYGGGVGSYVHVRAVRQEFQAIVDVVDAPADPYRLTPVPVPVLRQALSPEVGHEEAHLHPHWYYAALHVLYTVSQKNVTLFLFVIT